MTVIESLCSKDGPTPGLTTIRRPEREDRRLKTVVYGDDDRTIGLHERLSGDDAGMVGSRLCCTPLQSTVGGGAHLDTVEFAKVVELGVAVTIEGAAGRIIADRPVFVVKITTGIHHNGGTKCQSPIGRAADEHIDRTSCRILNAKPRDQPDFVFRVVGHRGVTGTEIRRVWRHG